MASTVHQVGNESQLPDFEIIARCLESLGTELAKLRNVPSFAGGAEILGELEKMRKEMGKMRQEIDGMGQEMEETREEMREEMRDMKKKVDHFDVILETIEFNNIARLLNRSLNYLDVPLSPLRKVATNELIDQFPATPEDIQQMSGAAIDGVLNALGVETDGDLKQRRHRLWVRIGLKARQH